MRKTRTEKGESCVSETYHNHRANAPTAPCRPENWGILSTTGLAPIPYTQQWLQAHIEDSHKILGKPLLVEEFGRSTQMDAMGAGREQYFDAVHSTVERYRKEGALAEMLLLCGLPGSWAGGRIIVL